MFLLDVRYTGADGHDPDLATLSSALALDGGRVSFVHGGIDRIQGHAQGRLVVAVQLLNSAREPGALASRVAVLIERARRHADHVEVLGYV
jgi:D-methionine transport system ATP-binding protein